MAKKVYTGISNTACQVKKMYVGIDGVARKVKKGYIGVNGIAQQFYASETGLFISVESLIWDNTLNISKSSDGMNWTASQYVLPLSVSSSNIILGGACINGVFVFVTGKYFIYSTDGGDSWNVEQIHSTRKTVCASNNCYNYYDTDRMVLISYEPGYTGYVGDVSVNIYGPHVSFIYLGSYSYNTICCTEDNAVAVGGNTFLWNVVSNPQERAIPLGANQSSWNSVAYGVGKYVVTGDGTDVSYSTDGSNWTLVSSVFASSGPWSVVYCHDKFYAFAGAVLRVVYYSTDGISWTQINFSSINGCSKIIYGNGIFVARGGYGSLGYSTDGINWTFTTQPSIYSNMIYGTVE